MNIKVSKASCSSALPQKIIEKIRERNNHIKLQQVQILPPKHCKHVSSSSSSSLTLKLCSSSIVLYLLFLGLGGCGWSKVSLSISMITKDILLHSVPLFSSLLAHRRLPMFANSTVTEFLVNSIMEPK
ncbi:hypothetical protein CIPAW_03G120800 [Carya illinoinensis]|uniref:Uncharacterized protein n=1 Tax=Carya illinoinensis TaxID=32201 RepID=A0A8T1QZX1_CARIL|nr:hypothetical protein CIPAW_03G120800 [Carya illinoinensis]